MVCQADPWFRGSINKCITKNQQRTATPGITTMGLTKARTQMKQQGQHATTTTIKQSTGMKQNFSFWFVQQTTPTSMCLHICMHFSYQTSLATHNENILFTRSFISLFLQSFMYLHILSCSCKFAQIILCLSRCFFLQSKPCCTVCPQPSDLMIQVYLHNINYPVSSLPVFLCLSSSTTFP